MGRPLGEMTTFNFCGKYDALMFLYTFNKYRIASFVMRVLTTRIPDELFKMVEKIGKTEKAGIAEVTRRLLSEAVERWKVDRALRLLEEGKVTLRGAAKIAGLTYVEMLDMASEKGVAIAMKPQDVVKDLSGA